MEGDIGRLGKGKLSRFRALFENAIKEWMFFPENNSNNTIYLTLLSAYCVPSTILSNLHELTHLILLATL